MEPMNQNSARLKVGNFTVSLDGFVAGPNQSLENPLGIRGEELPPDPGGECAFAGIGATIMGRNMFGPIRGPRPDYRGPAGGARRRPITTRSSSLPTIRDPPVRMAGGTTFHFVTDGIEVALEQALAAADGADVSLAGGAGTIQQYLQAGLVDELHIVISRSAARRR